MRQIPLFKKLEIDVPNEVITSLWNMFKTFENNYAKDYFFNFYDKISKVKTFEQGECQISKIKGKIANSAFFEIYKLRTEWLWFDENVSIVDEFIKTNFNSAFQFRLDRLKAGKSIDWHKTHPYPRVFIPMHDTTTEYFVKRDDLIESKKFKLGECWLWDVRELHSVENINDVNDRIIACFCIDPRVESKANIFL